MLTATVGILGKEMERRKRIETFCAFLGPNESNISVHGAMKKAEWDN